MKEDRPFDVLIVGAGPAGSSAAYAAAKAGAHVLVVDKGKRIGEPMRCAEYIPRLLAQRVKVPKEAIAQDIEGIITFLPNGEAFRKSAPGFILNRARFDQALASEAKGAGAKILTQTRAIYKEHDRVKTLGPSGEAEIRASLVIGADGPDSAVGSWIGQKNRRVMWAVQQTLELKHPSRDTEVYFDRAYPGGYGWLFPKGEIANVGVGVRRELGGVAKEALKGFKERVRDRIGKVIRVTAGLVPVGGPLRSIDEDSRIILIGDAAGHTHPITGGGLPQAVIGGAMAGRAAAVYVKGHKGALQDYAEEWQGAFGNMLEMAGKKREELEAGWYGEHLTELVRRCWIACEEYYRDA